MLSYSAKYALKAIHYISHYANEDEKVTANKIAKVVKIPKPYLSKLLKKLSAEGFISSVRGPKGGFYLTHEQKQRSILDLITSIEGANKFQLCILNFKSCNHNNPCPIHNLVINEKESLRKAIQEARIVDMSNDFQYLL